MQDLVTRLRTWVHAVHAVPVSDLLDEAADEIERLRNGVPKRCETVSLSDAERAAMKRVRRAFRGMDDNDMTMQHPEDYEALCGLLARLSPPATRPGLQG